MKILLIISLIKCENSHREKSSLHRGVEKLKSEVAALRELQDSRTEAIKELLELKEKFQGELNAAQADLIDEASNREGMDRRLAELRTEVHFFSDKKENLFITFLY